MIETSNNETGIDWDAVRRRVDEAGAELHSKFELSDDQKKSILETRAQQFAQPLTDEIEKDSVLDVLVFQLSGENYGIELSEVNQACSLDEYTIIPGAESHILGVMNIHGRIVTIVESKVFLSLPQIGLTELSRVLIVESENAEFGLLVDSLQGVRSISTKEIDTTFSSLSGIRKEHFRGITADSLVILDIKSLFAAIIESFNS